MEVEHMKDFNCNACDMYRTEAHSDYCPTHREIVKLLGQIDAFEHSYKFAHEVEKERVKLHMEETGDEGDQDSYIL